MRLIAWLSGRRRVRPELDTPAEIVVVIKAAHRSFIMENLEERGGRCMHIDVFADFAYDTGDQSLIDFAARAARFSDWIHVEDDR